MAAIKEIFRSVVGLDLSGQMEHDPSVFSRLLTAAKDKAGRAAKTGHLVHDGLYLSGTDRSARTMEGNVFSGDAAPTFFNPAWNRARVTVRGETAALECIEARATTVGFFLRFR